MITPTHRGLNLMTNFKETLPQIKVIRKTKVTKKSAVSHDKIDDADEKQILCTIKKMLEHDLEITSENIEAFKAHLDELNKELDYYKNLIEVARKDAIFMDHKIKLLNSENIKMKKDEH